MRGIHPLAEGFGVDPDDALFYSASTNEPRSIAAIRGDQSQFYIRLARALQGKEQFPVSRDDAIAVMSILEAAAESAVEGRSIVPRK